MDELDEKWRNPKDGKAKIQKNNRLPRMITEKEVPFPHHLKESDYPRWAFRRI